MGYIFFLGLREGTVLAIPAGTLFFLHLKNAEYLPLIPINIGAISENLVNSQLFGHEKGAFAGDISMHTGDL